MDQEQKLELGRQIWQLCRAGYNRIEIIQELGISVQQLEDAYREFESQLAVNVGRAMDHYRNLDNERIEEIMEALMPLALGDGTPVDQMSDAEFDLQLKASYAVLGCIDQRCKIITASRPEKTSVRDRSIDVLTWLQQFPAGPKTRMAPPALSPAVFQLYLQSD